ncbi:MAG: EF-P lysine aminoacylase GenX, partial [Desulfobacterales bacterium]|nr:EF-P lysine aminoacylase GenX [Desulfobacterales bacterium]
MPFHRQHAIKRNLNIRARTVQAVRAFFIEKDYLEIDTPCRIPAPAPEEHIDAQTSGSWYLQTSPELCMKRLLAAGYPRIFQICKCFRQNERGSKHLPELTMLEWYTLETDYFDMMAQTEDLIGDVVENINSNRYLVYQGNKIELKKPWPKISVTKAFDKFTSTTMESALSQDLFDELL